MMRQRAPAVIAGIAAAVLFLLAGASRASANTITFDLTSDHCTGGCGPQSSFGTVALTQSGTSVNVVVTLLNGNEFVRTGSADLQAFKFNATGVALSDITLNTQPAPHFLIPVTGALNGDGTGDFAFGIFCAACAGGASDKFAGPINFTVANATIADLTAPNADGNVFVADIISGTTGNTGPVDASGPGVPSPEASAVTMTALVLLAFGGLLVRARRKPA